MKVLKSLKRIDPMGWAAILFAISFNLGIASNSVGFALFVFVGIVMTLLDMRSAHVRKFSGRLNLPPIIFFVIIVMRELVANPSYTLQIVNVYLAFLIVPLIVWFQTERLKFALKNILLAFLFGCVLNATVNIGLGIYRGVIANEQGINFWYLTYDLLSEPFGIQPIYQALFYVFGVFILLDIGLLRKNKILFYSIFALLATSTILLAARNAIVCLVLLTPLFMLVKRKVTLKNLGILAAILAVSFTIALQNPVVKNRILKVNRSGNFFSGTSLRENIWGSALFVAEKEFVWGVGEQKGEKLLLEQYEARNLKVPVEQKYHAHNQFLQTLVQYGVIGFLALIMVFMYPLFHASIYKKYLGLFWCLLFILTSLTESVFARQWGVFSYAFFASLVLIDYETFKKGQKKYC